MDLLTLGKQPISSSAPAGVDVRYEPEFDELQMEIGKLSKPRPPGVVDWNVDWKKVNELASGLLANKGKDLLVASYLAEAQIQANQLEGFAVGLRLYRDLLEQFWEDLHPAKKRMQGRIAAIEWWLDRIDRWTNEENPASQSLKAFPLPAKRVQELRQDVHRIEELLRGYLEEPPDLKPLERLIDSILVEAKEKPEPEVPAPEAIPQARAPLAAAAPLTVDTIASLADAEKVVKSALHSLRRACNYLQDASPSNPVEYRWRRLAAWSMVEAIPQATDGKTNVPPPDLNIRTMLNDLREKGNWKDLVESSEERVSESIFWLDLNRFVAEGLNGLGGPYQDAHDAVCQETAFFLLRFPGVESLCFTDGTPFADPATWQWLRSIRLGVGPGLGEPLPSAGTGDGDRMAEATKKAEELAKKKKLAEAVSLLQRELRSAFSKKDQLLWRMALCQILLNAKKPELALPHLEAILRDIDVYRLEEWDPDMALKGLKMVWSGVSTQSGESSKERALDVLNRLARLDPAGALSLRQS